MIDGRRASLGIAVVALAYLTGCAAPAARSPRPREGREGIASWYGRYHQGRLMASGEAYDMARLTAAHRTLPLGTRVRVTNVENGRAVVVRITDRGPYVAGRAIDLSYAAARRLDIVDQGLARVRLEVLPKGGAS